MKKIYVHAFHTENNIVIVVHIFFFATRCIFFSQFYFAPIKKIYIRKMEARWSLRFLQRRVVLIAVGREKIYKKEKKS